MSTAEIRIITNGKHKETICAEIIVIDRQLAVFAYNNRPLYCRRVTTKDGGTYYTAGAPDN